MNRCKNNRIAVFGECMLELSLQSLSHSDKSTPAKLAFGDDTLNMSVYLARLGTQVDYITALGDDNSANG